MDSIQQAFGQQRTDQEKEACLFCPKTDIPFAFLGDSITTFEGFIPVGYKLFYTPDKIKAAGMSTVLDTWWMQLASVFDTHVAWNNSYSGSLLSGTAFPGGLSLKRRADIKHQAAKPVHLFMYFGINDYGFEVDLPEFRHAVSDLLDFLLSNLHPQTKLYVIELMDSYVPGAPELSLSCRFGANLSAYQRALCETAKLKTRTHVITNGNVRYESFDGTHPTKLGMSQIAAHLTKEYAHLIGECETNPLNA